jgi:hypothetical protein
LPSVTRATAPNHGNNEVGFKAPPKQQKGFASETASATGINKSTVTRAIASAIPKDVRDQIKGTYLDSIKGMEPDNQRDLSESQRAMVASRLAKMERGRPSDNSANLRNKDATEMLNVSTRSVESARAVRDKGDESLVESVERGVVSVSAAADMATLPKQEQAEIVAKGEREILEAAKQIRAQKQAVKCADRDAPLTFLSNKNAPLPQDRRYPVIYADPPWENGYCESFNARFRDELLNGEIFYLLREAQILIEQWRRHYNTVRPHSALGYRPPAPESIIPMDQRPVMYQQFSWTTQWGLSTSTQDRTEPQLASPQKIA